MVDGVITVEVEVAQVVAEETTTIAMVEEEVEDEAAVVDTAISHTITIVVMVTEVVVAVVELVDGEIDSDVTKCNNLIHKLSWSGKCPPSLVVLGNLRIFKRPPFQRNRHRKVCVLWKSLLLGISWI